jgi:hypothetical protein
MTCWKKKYIGTEILFALFKFITYKWYALIWWWSFDTQIISCYSYLAFSYIAYFNQQNTKIIKQVMEHFMLGTMP